MVYAIFCRYEYWVSNHKTFCDYYNTGMMFNSENEAKEKIKELKDLTKTIDKATKLKHEYEYKYIDETLIEQPKWHRPKGRPKKFDTKELDTIINVLNKNGNIKIEGDMKVYLYNDDKAKEYISNHIKDKTKWTRYWYDDDYNLFIFLKDKN